MILFHIGPELKAHHNKPLKFSYLLSSDCYYATLLHELPVQYRNNIHMKTGDKLKLI